MADIEEEMADLLAQEQDRNAQYLKQERRRNNERVAGRIWIAILLVGFALWVWNVVQEPTTPAAQEKLMLCQQAAACKKYSEVRLECATAGSFKTCLRIKMGDNASYSGPCSGYVEGAPAVPPPPGTPSAFECFFRTLLR
jgi:hypothetical protein